MADDDLDLGEEKKSSKKMLFIILAMVIVLFIGGGAAAYFMGLLPFGASSDTEEVAEEEEGEAEEEASEKKVSKKSSEAFFYDFEPFIVNFPPNREARLLQISFSALTHDEAVAETLTKHAPLIRNNLLLLLGRFRPSELKSTQGKEALLNAITQEIQKALDMQKEGGEIEAVFYTQFIMQ
ncbi:MAG: hypothetical protein AXA67_01945 [Methylothermaceae bacteria B42]|nr:MAG: hypothetical protein AXA67_01945 [Methylothermaceae bacteria B42]HHJ37872.1 hypothetical protein [Methylothermaceae bacterium]